LKPWFERREKRLGIEAWPIAANANNEVLKRGCQALGYDWGVIPRNVRNCLSLGFCGMGCPVRLGSAHVMGGCAMSDNAKQGVTNSRGVHHQLENLSIHDGSLFPTSIGANPQLSIYAITALLTNLLARQLRNA